MHIILSESTVEYVGSGNIKPNLQYELHSIQQTFFGIIEWLSGL